MPAVFHAFVPIESKAVAGVCRGVLGEVPAGTPLIVSLTSSTPSIAAMVGINSMLVLYAPIRTVAGALRPVRMS